MSGVDAETGELMPEGEHLRQSIADILMTPIGSRVMRRDYGSYLSRLIDQPADPVRSLALLAAAADAIRRWEPRVILRRISLDPVAYQPGTVQGGIDPNLPANHFRRDEAKKGHFTLNIEAFLRSTDRPQQTPTLIDISLSGRPL